MSKRKFMKSQIGTRGYSIIALDNPKKPENVGGAMRAAAVYGASMVVVSGKRPPRWVKHHTNTLQSWRHIPSIMTEDVFDAVPYDCVPVAIEIIEDARWLPEFTHPIRAFYIFGAEDATLGRRILDRCAHVVRIPTHYCMNLAATVNVVLYDRMAKMMQKDPLTGNHFSGIVSNYGIKHEEA